MSRPVPPRSVVVGRRVVVCLLLLSILAGVASVVVGGHLLVSLLSGVLP